MTNQNFSKFFNRGISTPIVIFVIVLVAIIAGGGILMFQRSVECNFPVDCENRYHIMCVGEWECVGHKCVWNCEIGEMFKDETADWKTYRNKEYGFEMKYPEDFLSHTLSSKGILSRVGFWDKDCSLECGSVEVSVRDKEGRTFQQIKEEAESIYSSLFSKNIILEEMAVDGRQAYIHLGYEFALGGVTVVGKKYIYDISRWYSSEDVPEELFHQILSTFRFLE